MSVDKGDFLEQAADISKALENAEIYTRLIMIYQYYQRNIAYTDRPILMEIYNIIKELVYNPIRKDMLVDFEFMNTPVGKVLFQVYFGSRQKAYLMEEIAYGLDKSKSGLNYDVDSGLLHVERKRTGNICYEGDLIHYLRKKKYTEEEILEILYKINNR